MLLPTLFAGDEHAQDRAGDSTRRGRSVAGKAMKNGPTHHSVRWLILGNARASCVVAGILAIWLSVLIAGSSPKAPHPITARFLGLTNGSPSASPREIYLVQNSGSSTLECYAAIMPIHRLTNELYLPEAQHALALDPAQSWTVTLPTPLQKVPCNLRITYLRPANEWENRCQRAWTWLYGHGFRSLARVVPSGRVDWQTVAFPTPDLTRVTQ